MKLPAPHDLLQSRSSTPNLTLNYPYVMASIEKYTYTEVVWRTPFVQPHTGCSGGEPRTSGVNSGMSGAQNLEGRIPSESRARIPSAIRGACCAERCTPHARLRDRMRHGPNVPHGSTSELGGEYALVAVPVALDVDIDDRRR